MIKHPLTQALVHRVGAVWEDKESLLRGLLVTLGGILMMFSCLTILTLSSCTLAP